MDDEEEHDDVGDEVLDLVEVKVTGVTGTFYQGSD